MIPTNVETVWGPLILLGLAAMLLGWSLIRPRKRKDDEH